MPTWILFGLGAALALGAANIPQKLALGTVSPFAYGILSGLVILIVNITLLFIYGDSLNLAAKKEWGFAFMAAALFAAGSVFIALGYRGDANPAIFPALFNTNTLIATILGVLILKETLAVPLWQAFAGSAFVVIGAVLVTTRLG